MKRKHLTAAALILAMWLIAIFTWCTESPRAAQAEPLQTVDLTWEPIPEYVPPEPVIIETYVPEFIAYEDVPLPEDMQIFMQQECKELDLSYEFALALMETESSFNPDAVGDGGRSVGYMQINQCNWQRMADDYGLDVSDEKENVAAGLRILRELFDQNTDPYYVILCYKAGIGNGAKLYEQKKWVGDTYDCIAICERAAQWERSHGK
ncbi:lytic transglycosylase domain-containing protein [Butyrivibrio sp. INlla14]|uniref:lytic transglycosylase domain-containing protein n=1 Tax=Butyrivibrio sp. INlla14 TaxID=1520808 RepID=UPI0015A31BE4|nr:lytic transglycosylase domain-containing protein [Butyrivibrio sp. INlla14]